MAYTYGTVKNCKVKNGQTRSEYEVRLGYQVNSQDIANNKSNVSLRLEVRSIKAAYCTKGTGQTTTIDGTKVADNKSFDMSSTNTWKTFGTKTMDISHNADGTCSVSKSGSFTATAGSSDYSLRSGSAKVTVSPPTIPRASDPSFNVYSLALDGSSRVTVYTNRASSSFTHRAYYSIDEGTTWNNLNLSSSEQSAASFTWLPSTNIINQIPNSTSVRCWIKLETYSGSTYIGSHSTALTLTVPNNILPSISSISISEGNTDVSSKNWGVYVQNKSKLLISISASGNYSSTIKNYSITGIDNKTYNSANFISDALQNAGTQTITVTVTDSRGRTASKTATYTCISYTNPIISLFGASRCNSDGSANEEGSYIKYTFVGSISPVNNKNNKLFRIGYKRTSESTYTYKTIINSAYEINKTTAEILSDVIFDASYSYSLSFEAQDSFTLTKKEMQLSTGFSILDFHSSGKGMAIGKVSEKDAFEVDLPTTINKDINIKANIVSSGNSNWKVNDNVGNTPIPTNGCGIISGGDGANNNTANMKLYSWYGIGFSPSISGQPIPQGENAVYINVRNGDLTARGNINNNGNIYTSTVNGVPIRTQRVLWEGAMYMNGSQTATLSERVSEQANGIVLVFTGYSNGTARNWNTVSHFVPKKKIELLNGVGEFIPLGGTEGISGFKYVYLTDTGVGGNDKNQQTVAVQLGNGAGNGIDVYMRYNNYDYVLRYVIGV